MEVTPKNVEKLSFLRRKIPRHAVTSSNVSVCVIQGAGAVDALSASIQSIIPTSDNIDERSSGRK